MERKIFHHGGAYPFLSAVQAFVMEASYLNQGTSVVKENISRYRDLSCKARSLLTHGCMIDTNKLPFLPVISDNQFSV